MQMAHNIELTAALGDYDIHRALIQGDIKPEGIDLTVLPLRSQERHWRMYRHDEFDIAEFSMSTYLMLKSDQRKRWTAIPVFPHRRFRHSYIFINPTKSIRSVKDLEGKRIGLRTWQATMGVWVRGILQEEYGLDLRSINWFTQDPEILEVDLTDVKIQRVPEGTDIDQMLKNGELDAVIYPDLLPSFLAGDPNIGRLFVDYKQEEINYYRKTGIFPIMHTLVIKESVLDKFPWVAENLMQAFRRSKEDAWKRMEDPRLISLAWVRELIEEQHSILGTDPWPTGLDANRKALQKLMAYSLDQGLIKPGMKIEDLFYPSTLDENPGHI
jgi:4,5-dihydroxyphthalate decarboxylase